MCGLSRDYPAFPEIETHLGYNPARFLDQPVGKDDQTVELSAKGLIRGIQDIATIRAWIEIEVTLGRADDGPRRQVITWLNRRQAHIEEERSERSASTATTDDREQPSSPGDECPTDHSEPASDAEATEPVPAEPSTTDAIDGDGESSTTATAVATDGGAPDPDTPPRCPDCHGALPEETVAEDDAEAAWCAHCGAMKPLGGPA